MESYGTPAGNIGERMRQQRLSLNRSLADVGAQLKLSSRYLEAIENNDLSAFPGIVFTRNFVRQYALALDLDPEPLLEQLPKLDQSTVPLPDPPRRPRARRTRLNNQNWVSTAVVVVLALGVTGAYLYHDQGWRITLERRSPAEQDTVKAQSFPPVAESSSADSAPAQSPSAALPPREFAAAARSTAPAEPVQVVLTARERAWVSVKVDGSSHYAYIGTLSPGETRTVSAAEQVRIMTGNAGGLDISLNGKLLDTFGRHGQSRSIRLTAEGPEVLGPEGRSPDAASPRPAEQF